MHTKKNYTAFEMAFDPPPTPAAIQSFNAIVNGTGEKAILSWSVEADEPIRGFNVYRKNQGQSREIRLNRGGWLEPGRRQFTDNSIVTGGQYEYAVGLVKNDGSEIISHTASVSVPVGSTELYQNSPNPFNPRTTIGFRLDKPARVTLDIFDAAGRRVTTLIDHVLPAGYNQINWDGSNATGGRVGSGVYIYRLKTDGRVFSRKMTLLE